VKDEQMTLFGKPEPKKEEPKKAKWTDEDHKKYVKEFKAKQEAELRKSLSGPSVWNGATYTPQFVEQLLDVKDSDTTNIWRGLEGFDPTKTWDRIKWRKADHAAGRGDIIACIEVMEKEGKSHKEIVDILVKSKKRGLTVLFESWKHEDEWYLKEASEGLGTLSEAVQLQEKGSLTKGRYHDSDFSISWIEHLRRHEEDKQMWAKLIGIEYTVSVETQLLFKLAKELKEKINPETLPDKLLGRSS